MSKLGSALAAKRASMTDPEPVDTPEWWEAECFAYPITLADNDKIDRLAGDNHSSRMIHTIIEKLLDETGERVFDIGDVGQLKNEPSTAITQLYVALVTIGRPSVEDHIKN